MFSGIVEEQGIIYDIKRKKNLMEFSVSAEKTRAGTKIGDSVSVDGVCLTVSRFKNSNFVFDVMLETLRKTTLGERRPKDCVNLERALKVGDRLGGHFVLGHVDGVGVIKERIKKENYVEYRIAIDKIPLKYIAAKGSVAIDGISLTIGEVRKNIFSVYLIPHTLDVTTIGEKNPGQKVNIEVDVLARYILANH